MITDSGQFSEIIGDSLSFALTPAQDLPEMIAGGAQLMRRLSIGGLFLPPFAAVDIVTAFYTAGVGRFIFNSRSAITHPRSKLFERRYHNDYLAYLQWVRDVPEVKKLSLLMSNKFDEIMRPLAQQALHTVLNEIAVNCPFTRIICWADASLFREVAWPECTGGGSLDDSREFEVLAALGLNGCLQKQSIEPPLLKDLVDSGILENIQGGDYVAFDRSIVGSPDLVARIKKHDIGELDICLHHYHLTLLPPFDPETARGEIAILGLASLAQLSPGESGQSGRSPGEEILIPNYGDDTELVRFDMKLADLYSYYFNQFEPSQTLRQKIAELMEMSRNAITRNNFFDEFSQQGRQGMPNPAYVVQGTKQFLRRMHRGEAVFIDNDPPVREQEDIAIRFVILEDLGGTTEEVTDASSACFPCHYSIHKLLAMLVIQDVVKYLGQVSRFDVRFDVIVIRESLSPPELTTEVVSRQMSKLLFEGSIAVPFLLLNDEFLRLLLMDGELTEVAHSRFDPLFYRRFDEQLNHLPSSHMLTSFNVVFGRAGMLFDSRRESAISDRGGFHPLPAEVIRFQPTLANTEMFAQTRRLIDDPTSFFCETHTDRYFLVGGGQDAGGILQVALAEGQLTGFLGAFREYILEALVDEALKLMGGSGR
ncbi:hypothetical protein N8198_02755 [Gammaproteobacteria bacterium]|nr:hypothetical protein [Gammaproteobacteria bacterium]